VIYGLYKLYIRYHCSEADGDIEFQSISEQIEHLNELREKLPTLPLNRSKSQKKIYKNGEKQVIIY